MHGFTILARPSVWFKNPWRHLRTQRSALKDEEMKLPFFANADSLYKDYAQFLIESHRSRDALQLLDQWPCANSGRRFGNFKP